MTRPVEIRIGRLVLAGRTQAEARAFARAVERALAVQLAAGPAPTPGRNLAHRQAELPAASPRAVAAGLHRLVTK